MSKQVVIGLLCAALVAACSSAQSAYTSDGVASSAPSRIGRLAEVGPIITPVSILPEIDIHGAPPCRHPGDELDPDAPKEGPRCRSSNQHHVSYWQSRPDVQRLACAGLPADHCNETTGMVPHCHGWGPNTYCHAHPGGEFRHDHLDDFERTAKLSKHQGTIGTVRALSYTHIPLK